MEKRTGIMDTAREIKSKPNSVILGFFIGATVGFLSFLLINYLFTWKTEIESKYRIKPEINITINDSLPDTTFIYRKYKYR